MSAALPSMSGRMLRADVSTEVRTMENPLSIAVQSPDSPALAGVDLGTAISLALSRCGLSHKQACAFMDLDASLWARQLQGKDNAHISLQRLARLPERFWREFLPLLAEAVHMTVSHPDLADEAMRQIVDLVAAIGRMFEQSRARRIA